MVVRITRQWRFAAPLVIAVAATVVPAGAARAEGDEAAPRLATMAELNYTTGVTATFTLDEESGDTGFIQDGTIGRNGPLLDDLEGRSLLEVYLAVTPGDVAVPRQIIDSHPPEAPLPPELAARTITADVVRVSGLAVPPTAAASVTCWSVYYGWVHWYDPSGVPNPASVHHAMKSYANWSFGGKKKYSNSFVGNCGIEPARHRIYYGSVTGWTKHWDKSIEPNHWQAVTIGSIKRDRMVRYDAGSGYTRSGRFRN